MKKEKLKRKKAEMSEESPYSWSRLFWIFLLASFLGALLEIVFCFLTTGQVMSRSSLVIGQFSLVWGLGVVLFTLTLRWMRNRTDRCLFLAGTLMGGVFEYLCSLLTEILFGGVFWDYSRFKLNLGGRINLLFCVGWGAIAILWARVLYPRLSVRVDRIAERAGRLVTAALALFMVGNMLLSTIALDRYMERQRGHIQEDTEMDAVMDRCFPDSLMEERYPSLKIRLEDGSLTYPGRAGNTTLKSVVSQRETENRMR